MLIIVLGAPCSGKATLISHLVREHGFLHASIGEAGAGELEFESSTAFLDWATAHWRVNVVTDSLRRRGAIEEFAKRPFCGVVHVEAPVGVRWRRARCVRSRSQRDTTRVLTHCVCSARRAISLEEFIEKDDLVMYGTATAASSSSSLLETPTKRPSSFAGASPIPSPPASRRGAPEPAEPLAPLIRLASLTLENAYATTGPFYASVSSSTLLAPLAEELRPSWDPYFMLLAALASRRSNCMKRRVGAVLVREKRVVSTGYNGTPRGVRNCSEGGCGRCNSWGDGQLHPNEDAADGIPLSSRGTGLDVCLCLHAEENALLEAGRSRASGAGAEGTTLYCNTCVCVYISTTIPADDEDEQMPVLDLRRQDSPVRRARGRVQPVVLDGPGQSQGDGGGRR